MKTIPDFKNYYITKSGRIWSKRRKGSGCSKSGKWLKPSIDIDGYLYVDLCKNNKRFRKKVHQLVLETFVCKRPNNMEVCHNDGNIKNNKLANLRWDTHKSNIHDSVKHGTFSGFKTKGDKNGMSKLTAQEVYCIITLYKTGLQSQRKIAKQFGVSQKCIGNIVNKKAWKHIWEE